MFWLAALVVLVAVLWLLSQVLLPFVAGMALAYLLNPLTRPLERLGIGRLLSPLVVIAGDPACLVRLILMSRRSSAASSLAFIDNIPGYVRRLQSLITDPSRPWLRQVFWRRSCPARTSRSATS